MNPTASLPENLDDVEKSLTKEISENLVGRITTEIKANPCDLDGPDFYIYANQLYLKSKKDEEKKRDKEISDHADWLTLEIKRRVLEHPELGQVEISDINFCLNSASEDTQIQSLLSKALPLFEISSSRVKCIAYDGDGECFQKDSDIAEWTIRWTKANGSDRDIEKEIDVIIENQKLKVQSVMKETGCSRVTAIITLEVSKGDVQKACDLSRDLYCRMI